MSRPLIVEPEAEEEIEAAILWYEQLGRDSAGASFTRFRPRSIVFSVSPAPVRRCRTFSRSSRCGGVRSRAFPTTSSTWKTSVAIHLLAVAHDRRRPGYWSGRLAR